MSSSRRTSNCAPWSCNSPRPWSGMCCIGTRSLRRGREGRAASDCRPGGSRWARDEQQALIEPADAEEHDAEPDEGERLVDPREFGHFDQEDLQHREDRDRGGSEAYWLRTQPAARREQRHPESEPDRRIGILLRVAAPSYSQYRAVIEARHLQGEIGQRERDRRDGGDDAV